VSESDRRQRPEHSIQVYECASQREAWVSSALRRVCQGASGGREFLAGQRPSREVETEVDVSAKVCPWCETDLSDPRYASGTFWHGSPECAEAAGKRIRELRAQLEEVTRKLEELGYVAS
jgi:hypothetical protein